MVQKDVAPPSHRRPRQPRKRERALRLRAQPDVLRRVRRQVCPVHPESEKRVRLRRGGVDEYLRDVDVPEEGLVKCGGGVGWDGEGGNLGRAGGVGVGEREGGWEDDLFGWRQGGHEVGLDFAFLC